MNRTLQHRLRSMTESELAELIEAVDGEWTCRVDRRRRTKGYMYSQYMADEARGKRLAPRLKLAA